MSVWDNLKSVLEEEFAFSLNKNQFKDIKRLIHEICVRESINPEQIITRLKNDLVIRKAGGRNKFFVIKKNLINQRFPITAQRYVIDTKSVYLPELKSPLVNNYQPQKKFVPEKIFVEKEAKDSMLVCKFKNEFPEVDIKELNYYAEYLRKNKFSISELKRPLIFIVKERWDFVKPCPCTKHHLPCFYWIFNLGFGCPFDCSYCFLQVYSNFPGIMLPYNLDDFFQKFDKFYKKLSRPIRIGTGEFCDSLALDEITGYSKQLIEFFGNKNLFFELKTKSNKIKNILESKSFSNVVISWSLNPQKVIESEELAANSLEERITAAQKVQKKGFSIGFHFDPIIYYRGWEADYKNLVEYLYEKLEPPFEWISLGSLRANRELKIIVEQRFPQSKIFYEELFLGEDKKLRYPKFLRTEIYKKMIKWIRRWDHKTPIYLCMESKEIWNNCGFKFSSPKQIEEYLLSGNLRKT